MLSAMVADAIAIPFLGSQPFLSGFPAGITLPHPADYLLVAVLAVIAALFGLAFKGVLYKTEDLCDKLWGNRPQWARPAVGGVLLGLLLLAIPQMYGVGYPVMFKATGGGYVLWFLILLAVAKIAATSLTMGIGGSGGVFAPSLFIGVTSGMAFGDIAHHLFGAAAGPPALYAVVGMGAVFTSAARAPLTSLASVVEMTGDFTLTLPVMLAVAVASTVSRALSYGTIYTTKLLRRGTDIDRTTPWRILQDLKVSDAMQAFQPPFLLTDAPAHDGHGKLADADGASPAATLPGPVTGELDPQTIFATESLAQALRQLEIYGRDGLPVLSDDARQITGWVTNTAVIGAVAREIRAAQQSAAQAQEAAEAAGGTVDQAAGRVPQGHQGVAVVAPPPNPLPGYRIVEITLPDDSPAAGTRLSDVTWPAGYLPVSLLRNRHLRPPEPHLIMRPGDRIALLTAEAS
jgi:CIC family chloride channel protein